MAAEHHRARLRQLGQYRTARAPALHWQCVDSLGLRARPVNRQYHRARPRQLDSSPHRPRARVAVRLAVG